MTKRSSDMLVLLARSLVRTMLQALTKCASVNLAVWKYRSSSNHTVWLTRMSGMMAPSFCETTVARAILTKDPQFLQIFGLNYKP